MNRKLVILTVALMFAMLSATAFEAKYYSDRTNGYSGVAAASFLGTTAKGMSYLKSELSYFVLVESLEEKGAIVIRPLEKLSKAENFLICEALGEYDVRDGEVYKVALKCDNSYEYLTVYVDIRNKGKNYYWYTGCYWK